MSTKKKYGVDPRAKAAAECYIALESAQSSISISIGVPDAMRAARYTTDENSNGDAITTMTTDIDDPTYISPVDIAAAFWYGNFRESDTTPGPRDDGSLYAYRLIRFIHK